MTITKSEQYDSAQSLLVFLDDLSLKSANKTRRHLTKREGEYWERCEHCGFVLGNDVHFDCPRYDIRHEPEFWKDR